MEKGIESLGLLLDRASWAMSNRLRRNLEANHIDLPHSQYILMRLIYEKEGLSQQEIAGFLHKDVAAIKRTLDNLEKKGLIIRTPLSLCKNMVTLTAEGKNLMPPVIEIARQTVTEVLENIPKDTYGTVIDFLRSIYENKL